ncbi:hypothetical protein Tco_0984969 [Tanacetum coccineum]
MPYPAKEIRRISAKTSQENAFDQFPIRHIHAVYIRRYPAWIECKRPDQETPCDKPVPVSETVTRTIIPPIDVDRPCFVDDAEDVLPQSKLECIASSTEMRDALKNEELQKLIRNIDCSANAETELEKAMEQEVFRLFTEKTFVPFALQVPRYDILTSRIAFLKVAAGTAQVVKQYSLLIPDNVKGHVLKLSLSPST